MSGTTDQDARALVHLARRLRDETHGCKQWDEGGTWAVFRDELIGQNLALSIERVLCHATDPEAKTPGSIKRPFMPPKPSERGPEPMRPPKPNEACRTCGGWCPGVCVRDQYGTDDEPVTDEDRRLVETIRARRHNREDT